MAWIKILLLIFQYLPSAIEAIRNILGLIEKIPDRKTRRSRRRQLRSSRTSAALDNLEKELIIEVNTSGGRKA